MKKSEAYIGQRVRPKYRGLPGSKLLGETFIGVVEAIDEDWLSVRWHPPGLLGDRAAYRWNKVGELIECVDDPIDVLIEEIANN